MNSNKASTLCHYFASSGGCWYGDRCWYSHIQDKSISREDRPFCTYFMSGKCRFGAACFNRHGPVDYVLKTQDLSDIDTSISTLYTSGSDQANASSPEVVPSDADVSRSSEECVKPRRKPNDITCGQCGVHYEGSDAYDRLKQHYLENLRRMDGKHTSFLSKGKFRKYSICGECDGREFTNAQAFLQHIIAKAKVTNKAQREHVNDLDCVAQMFVDRDAGNDSQKDFISFMCDYLTAFGDDSEDDLDLTDDELSRDMERFALFKEGILDDDLDDGIHMFGFDEDDVFDLLCQGIKPYDPEAGATLAIINGYIQ